MAAEVNLIKKKRVSFTILFVVFRVWLVTWDSVRKEVRRRVFRPLCLEGKFMESIAYFPLVILVTGVLASTAVKPLNKRLGIKITFCLGAMIAISASFWFFVQNVDGRKAVYAISILMGCGGSVMLVTSLSLIAQLIGHEKRSGAFVYGFIGFFDKLVSGATFAIIQELNPRKDQRVECFTCDEYTRHVQSIVPGAVAVLGLVSVMVFVESIFVCKRRRIGAVKKTESCSLCSLVFLIIASSVDKSAATHRKYHNAF
ncbi:Major facilitator super domain-containing protein 12 [Desmophyllum pertusum]|uniref:Major facilitator super domain-containing protein 12 n=1 Tax=Desmophyllum pertusum TaxID=174260 RepID=A0A9W9YZQ2_9CNID|nr:Major facilitator super domain-containing protein 12 [Desmophyllum pertusum]